MKFRHRVGPRGRRRAQNRASGRGKFRPSIMEGVAVPREDVRAAKPASRYPPLQSTCIEPRLGAEFWRPGSSGERRPGRRQRGAREGGSGRVGGGGAPRPSVGGSNRAFVRRLGRRWWSCRAIPQVHSPGGDRGLPCPYRPRDDGRTRHRASRGTPPGGGGRVHDQARSERGGGIASAGTGESPIAPRRLFFALARPQSRSRPRPRPRGSGPPRLGRPRSPRGRRVAATPGLWRPDRDRCGGRWGVVGGRRFVLVVGG